MKDLFNKFIQTEYFKNLDENPSNVIDSVTGVISRKYIKGYLEYITKENLDYSLIISDIDNFKAFNDSYGHLVGDEVLGLIGKRMINYLPDNVVIGRFGGDEFMIIVLGKYSYEEIWKLLKSTYIEIRKEATMSNGISLNITLTSGSATFKKDGDTLDEIINKADKALYRGKVKGRNCFIIYLDEKHKDLKFYEPKSEYGMMQAIRSNFKPDLKLRYCIHESLIDIWEEIQVDGIVFFPTNPNEAPIYCGNLNNILPLNIKDFESDLDNDSYVLNLRLKEFVPNEKLLHYLESYNIKACAIMLAELDNTDYGYIMAYCFHNRTWQELDLAVIRYLSDLISHKLRIKYLEG